MLKKILEGDEGCNTIEILQENSRVVRVREVFISSAGLSRKLLTSWRTLTRHSQKPSSRLPND